MLFLLFLWFLLLWVYIYFFFFVYCFYLLLPRSISLLTLFSEMATAMHFSVLASLQFPHHLHSTATPTPRLLGQARQAGSHQLLLLLVLAAAV